MNISPIMIITVIPGHAEHVGIMARDCVAKEVGRKKGQSILFEHAVAGDIIHTDNHPKTGVKGILIYDRLEFEEAKKEVSITVK